MDGIRPFSIMRLFLVPLALLAAVGYPAADARSQDVQACEISFVVSDLQLSRRIGGLTYRVRYDPLVVEFVGSLGDVACRALVKDVQGGSVPGQFIDDDAGTLSSSFSTAVGFAPFAPLAICELHAATEPVPSDFSIELQAVVDTSGATVVPPPQLFVNDVTCSGPVTTTTSTTTTTTSTTMGTPACADPVAPFGKPSATDCLFILRAAVAAATCAPECACAPTGTLPPKATDALICLKSATGQTVTLACPCS